MPAARSNLIASLVRLAAHRLYLAATASCSSVTVLCTTDRTLCTLDSYNCSPDNHDYRSEILDCTGGRGEYHSVDPLCSDGIAHGSHAHAPCSSDNPLCSPDSGLRSLGNRPCTTDNRHCTRRTPPCRSHRADCSRDSGDYAGMLAGRPSWSVLEIGHLCPRFRTLDPGRPGFPICRKVPKSLLRNHSRHSVHLACDRHMPFPSPGSRVPGDEGHPIWWTAPERQPRRWRWIMDARMRRKLSMARRVRDFS
jgi:hypothetical protein